MTQENDFMEQVREAVRAVMNEKDQAEKAKRVEALETAMQTATKEAEDTIKELSESLSKKTAEAADVVEERDSFAAKVEELEAKTKELQAKLEESEKSTEELKERASKAENELADISKDRALDIRMKELEEAKVASKGDRLEVQKAKVREMADEEFSAYKEQLVEIRSEVEKAVKEEAASKTEPGDNKVDVLPPDLDKADKAAAAINAETETETLKDKFAQMGKALAARMESNQ